MTISVNQYVDRLQPAIRLIEKTLTDDSPASVRELSNACNISQFHFHRIYRLLTGETCQQTIARLRLLAATNAMKDVSLSITDIAHSVGYSSSQAFAKAFKHQTGDTASAVRNDDEKLTATIEVLSLPDITLSNLPPVRVELTNLSPMTVVTIQTTDQYPKLNETYYRLFDAIGDPTNVHAILGIPGSDSAYLADEGNQFTCALLLNDAVGTDYPSTAAKDVTAGQYARVRHNGSYDDMENSIDALYLSIMESSDWQIADEACLFHYLDDPEETEEEALRTDLYLPIRAVN